AASLAAGGEVRVELGLELGSVEPERRDRIIDIDAAAGVGEFTREDERSGEEVGSDPVELIEVLNRNDRGHGAAVALDDDVLTQFGVLDQARDPAPGGRRHGHGPFGMLVGEGSHTNNCTENCIEDNWSGRAARIFVARRSGRPSG
ncbi:MAG TPA: hypothetical protein PLZ93_02890, partial [Nocardioides sp.]|nr:hypothetical protein [Nocardioides sp.]